MKLVKDFDKLKEFGLENSENQVIAYIKKIDFFRKVITDKLNFEERKSLEFIQVSTEMLENENLKA